ncbi:hypothetical protein BDZ89DRAFT_1094388 [Hymenopellis radicata]|nr:hypothetical protein BDZ89DRAFT_1094388 [Hymenopellis radicata]
MGDIQTRPFSKNYSGLINQSVIAVGITVLCVTGQELMKRRRRGKGKTQPGEGLGSRESWEFGYLFQGRSWAWRPSPPSPGGVMFPEEKMNQLRGVDATLYIRFLRGCFYFTLLHTLTTFPILFPIHVEFSEHSIDEKSMTRASISSLVTTKQGKSLLWIHICLLFWVTLSWIASYSGYLTRHFTAGSSYHPHPHPQYAFASNPTVEDLQPTPGLRLRTIMVSNVPPLLRSEKELKEYFEYFMSRKLERPAIGLTTNTQPGFFNKSIAYLFNARNDFLSSTLLRKMTELASLLERREEILRLLETAHIKLAKTTLNAVKKAMAQKDAHKPFSRSNSRAKFVAQQRKPAVDPEAGDATQEGTLSEEQRMEQLIKVLGPFGSSDSDVPVSSPGYPPASKGRRRRHRKTVWDALLSLPRCSLDAYQPLINLSHLFRGKTVPSIDYYTAKLNLLTSLITENRAKHATEYDPVSTAFYLAVHPHNPLTCMVSMAPEYQDLDWIRVMKSSFDAEFVKDWVVSLGVWAFTVFWLFPVSLLVGLVSIQNISAFWPGLKAYLDKHEWEEEVIQSFLPTLLVALLALLIPLILLLIAKKAHTITTLSAMHDRIMTRYYKFLIVNVLVFFCVGTAALQSFLDSFRQSASPPDILEIVASSFPSAGPFYVGWQIFTTAMHGGFEIALRAFFSIPCLPLIMYPTTRSQVTRKRKRAAGIRPRTFNYYYWLPTHLLLIHVLVVFAVLNPFVLPFGTFYFFVETGVIKNQLIHIYAKNYEGDGKLILIRIVRYSLDGRLIWSSLKYLLIHLQGVFLAYMVVLKKTANVGLAAVLIILTSIFKIMMTRMCRAQFEHDDIVEANAVCASLSEDDAHEAERDDSENSTEPDIHGLITHSKPGKFNFRIPEWVTFSYGTVRHHSPLTRQPNPFRPTPASFSRICSRSPENSPSIPSHIPTEKHADPFPLSIDVEPKVHNEDDFTGPVVTHPPPVAWDDLMTPDLPYDNPYYVRPISNSSTGKLGTWVGFTELDSPMLMSNLSLEPSLMTPTLQPSLSGLPSSGSLFGVADVDGTEEIELPIAIAKRVEAGESDIEQIRPRRPSTYRHRPSTGSSGRPQGSINQGSTAARLRSNSIMTTLEPPRPDSGRRSVSPGRQATIPHSPGELPAQPGPRTDSSLRLESSPQLDSPPRMHSTPRVGTLRPDAHAQADFAANASFSSLNFAPLRRAENISAHHAILREVMAEEEEAFVDRLESEEAQANTTRSFLTSWMFKKTNASQVDAALLTPPRPASRNGDD